ncbi:hypothetical protein LIN78_06785 [Leeia sp. TBRC 13508]|uniref:DUF4253 domain-containing protein n=1 Tax=Leeia speluncae TaxID=2884804 RepID=A0ABS8D4Z9_9NEIS|nr:hypothetical protein [Leeia speluncae]MCB6183246.1 hypothetical protein [Leeia speluncae]
MRIAHTASGMPAQWWMTAWPRRDLVSDCSDEERLSDWLKQGGGLVVRSADEHWLSPALLSDRTDVMVIDSRQIWLDDVLTAAKSFQSVGVSCLDQCPPDAFTAGMPWVLAGDHGVFDQVAKVVQPYFEYPAPLWFTGPMGSGHYLQAVFELCRYRTLVQWQAWMGDMQAPSPERIALLFKQDRHLLLQLEGFSNHYLSCLGLDEVQPEHGFAPQLAKWCVTMLPIWLEAIP